MKLIVGLGNPGEKYKNNRHNVGHMIADRLRAMARNKDLIIRKSNVFMNDSGSSVLGLINRYALSTDNLYIIHDDLDLPLGTWKIQIEKGPKEHGGINDIEQKLGTKVFTRIRVGVDNRKPEDRVPGEEYVLQDFTKEEKDILDKVLDDIVKGLTKVL